MFDATRGEIIPTKAQQKAFKHFQSAGEKNKRSFLFDASSSLSPLAASHTKFWLLRYYAIGLLKFCTFGFFLLGQLVDIILIATQTVGPADGSDYMIAMYGPMLSRVHIENHTHYQYPYGYYHKKGELWRDYYRINIVVKMSRVRLKGE